MQKGRKHGVWSLASTSIVKKKYEKILITLGSTAISNYVIMEKMIQKSHQILIERRKARALDMQKEEKFSSSELFTMALTGID
jgi:hypothetical protein